MPTYEITAPDGRVFEVTAPQGASQDQILAYAQSNWKPQKPATAADDVGAGEAALIAAGRGTDKVVQGVRQAYNWLTNDKATLAQMASAEAEKDAAYKPLKESRPFSTGVGEMAPGVAASFLTGGTSMLGGAASAALPTLLSYGSVEDRLKGAAGDAAFGAAGAKAGQLLARALKPAGVGTEGASKTAIDAAERIGYKPTPAQITQNPGMQAFENYLLRTPGSSGMMQKAASANQIALNRAGAKAMGEVADSLDEGVMASASKRIGGEFDRLGAITKPDLSGGFINALAKIDADNAARGTFRSGEIDKLVDKALDLAASNNLDGKAYKEIRTALANQAQAAYKGGDATTGAAYKSLYTALDDAAKASLSKADQEAWDVARAQWKAFKTLAKSNVAEAGNVSAPRAAAAVRAQGPQLRTGAAQGDLSDIARVGEAFKGIPNPTSGQLAQQMLFSNPITGLPLLAANMALASGYMSPLGQRYFSRGLLDVGQTGRGLLGQAGAQLAVPVGRALLGVE